MVDVIFWIGAAVVGWVGLGMATAMMALMLEAVLVAWCWTRASFRGAIRAYHGMENA